MCFRERSLSRQGGFKRGFGDNMDRVLECLLDDSNKNGAAVLRSVPCNKG